MRPERLVIPAELDGKRVDRGLSILRPGISRSAFDRLLAENLVTVNGKPCTKSHLLREGDLVSFMLPEPSPARAVPQDIELDIVYEDDDLLVVNKPQGMVVHPAAGNPDGTLVNALLHHCGGSLSGIGGVMRPGIVHRIDKNTSGLLIVAKNDTTHRALSEQIKAHSFTRAYEAVVTGILRKESGRIEAPIGRHPTMRKRMAVTDKNSKFAATYYDVVNRYKGYTHLRLKLETGRTHQIRVHLAHIGHPVAGDPVYGKAIPGLIGQCLHARTIGFIHPGTGEYMEFTSELPGYFVKFLNKLSPLDS